MAYTFEVDLQNYLKFEWFETGNFVEFNNQAK